MQPRSLGCCSDEVGALRTLIAGETVVAQANQDAIRLDHLRRKQFELLQRQATRSPFMIAVVTAVLVYVVSDHVPVYLVGPWALVQILLPFLRRGYALRNLRSPPEDVQVPSRGPWNGPTSSFLPCGG